MSRTVLPLKPIAVLSHNYESQSPLRSWPPVPADELHQGERLAINTFGSLLDGVRSPRHMYFTSWRDPDPKSLSPTEHGKQPTGILLVALFGVAPYESSPDIMETAAMFNELDCARLRLDLTRGDDSAFRLAGLELELNNPNSKTGRAFRSCWRDDEITGLDLSLQFDAPLTRNDPFRFHLSARLPRRYNHGAVIEQDHVEFTTSGGAMPLPRWVNF